MYIYFTVSEVYFPVSLLVQTGEFMPRKPEGHILIIALLMDLEEFKYFAPSFLRQNWAGLAKYLQDHQNLEATSLSDWKEKNESKPQLYAMLMLIFY